MPFQSFQADAFQADAFQVNEYLLPTGANDSAVGTTNVQGFNGAGVVISPPGIDPNYEVLFGVGVLSLAGTPNTPQNVTVPYFTDTSIPLPHVGARIGCTGFENQSFGNLTHETWKFGAGATQAFGMPMVGYNNVLVQNDSRLPGNTSVNYHFGDLGGNIYAFGLQGALGRPSITGLVNGLTGGDTLWGIAGVTHAVNTLPIWSTRFPSTSLVLKFPFGFSPFVEPDTFVATEYGTPTVLNAVADMPIPTEAFGVPMARRVAPAILRLRDTKNTTLKFDGVPFQFGFPKRDIFTVGVKPGEFGRLRPTSSVHPVGFDAQRIWDWSMPWIQPIIQTVSWPFSSGYAGHPLVGVMGTTVVNSTGQHGIRPKGEWLGTVASTLSVNNVNKSIHPYHGRLDPLGYVTDNTHEAFGTPAAAVDPNFIPAKYIYPQPFAELFRIDDWVWPVETRNLGPVGLGFTELGEFVQCVLLDPDYYSMQGFRDDAYGYPVVERRLNIRPTNWVTLWGAPQVTHYTRSVFPWQPWKETRFGELSFRYRTHISPAGIPPSDVFGDVHRWEENVIRLRPWITGGMGTVNVWALLQVAGIDAGGVPDPRMAVPIYADTFWATIMGHPPSVVYGSSLYNCGQMPRAVVPRGFPITQFGDFDAVL